MWDETDGRPPDTDDGIFGGRAGGGVYGEYTRVPHRYVAAARGCNAITQRRRRTVVDDGAQTVQTSFIA